MPSERAQFEIEIRTPAELGGLQAVERALERDIGRAKGLGQDFEALEERLNKVRAASAAYTARQAQEKKVAEDWAAAFADQAERENQAAEASRREAQAISARERQIAESVQREAQAIAELNAQIRIANEEEEQRQRNAGMGGFAEMRSKYGLTDNDLPKELRSSAKATEDLARAHDHASASAHKHSVDMLGLSHRSHEFRAAIAMLSTELPVVSELAHALFSPMTAMIIGGTIAIDKLKESIAEMEETFKEFDADGGARGEWAEEQADQLRKLEVAAGTFAHELVQIANAYKSVSEQAEKFKAAQERQEAANQASFSAQNSSAHAFIDLLEKLHRITPDQGITIKLRLDEAALKAELDGRLRKIDAEIAHRSDTGTKLKSEATELRDKGAAADAVEKSAKATKTKNDGEIKQTEENLRRDQERADKIKEHLDRESPADIEFIREHLDSKNLVSPNQLRLQRLLQEQRDLEGDEGKPGSGLIAGHKRALEQLRQKSVDIDIAAENATSDAQAVREAKKENLKSQKENKEKLDDLAEQRRDQAEQNQKEWASRDAQMRYAAAGAQASARDQLNQQTTLSPQDAARLNYLNNPANQIPIPTPGMAFPDLSVPTQNAVDAAGAYADAVSGIFSQFFQTVNTRLATLEYRLRQEAWQ